MAIGILSRKQEWRIQTPKQSIGVLWRQYLINDANQRARIQTATTKYSIGVLWRQNILNGANQRARIWAFSATSPPLESIHLWKNKISFNSAWVWLTRKKSRKMKIRKIQKKNWNQEALTGSSRQLKIHEFLDILSFINGCHQQPIICFRTQKSGQWKHRGCTSRGLWAWYTYTKLVDYVHWSPE